jgi:hypothetical protein
MESPAIGAGFIVRILVFRVTRARRLSGLHDGHHLRNDPRSSRAACWDQHSPSEFHSSCCAGDRDVRRSDRVFLVAGIVAIILNFIPILGQIAVLVMFVFLYIIFWVVILSL